MKMKLKRILFLALSFCFITYLSSCSSSEEVPEKEDLALITPTLEPDFEILKSSRLQVDVNSGKVNWTQKDQLLVFVHESGHQPTSTSGWNNCKYKFVTNSTDCVNNKFVQEAGAHHLLQLDPNKSYDWYVIYPYNETIISPFGEGKFTIGDQTMDLKNPTAHLESLDIMGNTLKSQKASEKVSLILNHYATLMQFTIHNQTNEDFIPQSVDFETKAQSSAFISGDFSVNTQEGLTATNGKNTLHLDISNPSTVSPNSTFTIYTIMAPFSLNAGDQFNVRVQTDKSNTLQSSTMKKTISFKAGSKSTANIKVTPKPITNQDIDPWQIQGESNDNIIVP